MSTRTRESVPGKGKRGTSPSHIGTEATQRRRSPNPSKTNSPVRSPDSTPSDKNIPRYLKPTLSSGTDVSKQQGKKPVSTTDSKPNLARRRSFDKPPSPSRTQISRVSPNPTLRSSSFSGKISTQKGASERNLKGPKDAGKQHTLYARPVNTVKKNTILAKKREPGSGSSRKERLASPPGKVDNPNIHDVPEPESLSEDQESVSAEDEEQTVQVGNINEKESEDSLLEDEKHMNINEKSEEERDDQDAEVVTIESPTILEQHEANIVMVESPTILEQHEAKIVMVESPTISETQDAKIVIVEPSIVSEQEDTSLDVNTEDTKDKSRTAEISSQHVNIEDIEDKSRTEEISRQQEEIKEHTTNEMSKTNTDESVAGNPSEEVKDKEKEQEEEDYNEEAETATNKKEELDSGNESHESMEKEVQEVFMEDKNEAENATPRVAHGKKDLALSNDVIEETANKLREQRKNKVKALAGAFETVISLQEPK